MNTVPGAQLHSRYNPQAEAERYIDALNLNENIECFILIEPGLGYLVQVLRSRFKNARIIALHVDNTFPAAGVPAWYGANAENAQLSVQDFLEREIPEIDSSRIRIIEWRPSLDFYGKAYLELFSQAVEFIKRADAGQRTVSAFGKRWLRNFFRNLTNVKQALLYSTMKIPVIVTGSGPGLEKTLPVIRQLQDECLILAASSSTLALVHGGITADMAIATDGGGWALQHIYPFFRSAAGTGKTGSAGIACNLCAALPSQCGDIPHLIMNDGSFWQSIVLHELALPSIVIAQKGTVTASAVELALLLTTGNIYLAGMDLSIREIRTHARPYGFDHLFWGTASRFAPVYSQSFVRSRLMQDGGSYGIYASWFKNSLAAWPKRIFSLGDNHEVFENRSFQKPAGKKIKKDYFKVVRANDDSACFCERGAGALQQAMDDPRFAKDLKTELTALLFPGEKEVPLQILKRAMAAIAVPGRTHG